MNLTVYTFQIFQKSFIHFIFILHTFYTLYEKIVEKIAFKIL